MDYVEMMQSFDHVLKRAPLNTTHWHIKWNNFVSMGDAVVENYLNLNILRSVKSKDYVRAVPVDELKQIVKSLPANAEVNAYSLQTKQYLLISGQGNRAISKDGQNCLIIDPRDLSQVIFLKDIYGRLVSFNRANLVH